jgi:hypothetical protein
LLPLDPGQINADPHKTVLAGMFLHFFIDYQQKILCVFAQNTFFQSYRMPLYSNCVNIFVLLITVNSTVNAYSPRTGVNMPVFADIRTLFRTVHNLLDMNVMDGTEPW